SSKTVEQIIALLQRGKVNTLDLTGGAPEMNANFRYLVSQAKALGIHVMDRCNLTILAEPGQEDLAEFLAQNKVDVVASLPCYSEDNVDKQRGKGVFNASIDGLKKLNALGYGKASSGLSLSLVYNPIGPDLPPPQFELQEAYKKILKEKFDIEFNQLFTITNMPIKRFGSTLVSKGQFKTYMQLLKDNYTEQNLQSVMCRNMVSVDWQGYLYDCDFNQMLDLPMKNKGGNRLHISQLLTMPLAGKAIAIADHCYGCTAGQGSSCGGALESV
ncbi:MAG TPA: radical SAM/Cys-rich domain protein, partial [Gammaproteobacteria bacterium]|nr:radical SAM/Cys-rich domain protein [Gammaproteobacteria bacterium]